MGHTIAIAGASQHGKTTLAQGLARAASPGALDLIDAPGGDLSNALAAQLDAAVVVISAADGPMKQTQEHVRALADRDVRGIAVFLNKTDLVDDDALLDLVEMEVRELFSKAGFDGDALPVLKGSALNAQAGRDETSSAAIAALAAALTAFAPAA